MKKKHIKAILIIVGVVLFVFGVYTLMEPETLVRVGELDLVKVQDNSNAYITIGLGFASILIGIIGGRNYRKK
ncbi:hypothetical protein [Mariniflexile sp.]|uniref:hypothetical protein n=1 Tax=Mariniflexile sp. TaxID=1979402 RepID=UPI00356B33EB